MPLPFSTIYKRVKDVLSRITGRAPTDIMADMELKKPPLRFDNSGLRALAPKLNNEFADQGLDLTRDETGALDTVRSIAYLIDEKIN